MTSPVECKLFKMALQMVVGTANLDAYKQNNLGKKYLSSKHRAILTVPSLVTATYRIWPKEASCAALHAFCSPIVWYTKQIVLKAEH